MAKKSKVENKAVILVVDDDFKDLSEMKSILESDGYKVEPATNGAQAIEALKTEKFDLILIDILMPTLSGYDLLRLLREKLNHKVKMVYVSIVPKKDAQLNDIDGYIQKPFSRKTFLEGVSNALR